MHHEMSSGTDAGQHVLHDPTATPPALRDADKHLDEAMEKGTILIINPASDGEIGYRVYVDEPLPEDLLPRAKKVESDLLLRAPSGQLVACGFEDLFREKFLTQKSELQVPPGDYLVEAWETDFDWDQDVAPVLQREVGAGYRRETTAGPLGVFLILAGIITLVICIFKASLFGVLAGVGVAGVGAGILALGMPKGDYWEKKDEIARRFPFLILILRRVDNIDGREGGSIQLA